MVLPSQYPCGTFAVSRIVRLRVAYGEIVMTEEGDKMSQNMTCVYVGLSELS